MKRKKRIVIGCSIAAAICFGIVSYGHFYRGRMALGWIFAILTASQLVIALKNYFLIEENKLIVIAISPSDKLGGADEYFLLVFPSRGIVIQTNG